MPKFRKRPIEIDAVQFVAGQPGAVRKFLGSAWQNLKWMEIKYGNRVQRFEIQTLEGNMYVSPGDWVIRGAKGEYYPCKPDIFEQTYERVVE